jgi:hypothetical protein
MKPKLKITLSMFFLAILLFMAILSFQNRPFWSNQIEPSQQILPQNYQALLPTFDNPLGSGEEMSFVEAQRRISYPIPMPEGLEPKQVWVHTYNLAPSLSEQSVAVEFNVDLLLIIHEGAKPPDWERTLIAVPELGKVSVNGNVGVGTDPGFTKYGGNEYPYPGSVQWWVNGLSITLYSDTMSLEELLKIAETILPTPSSAEEIPETPLPTVTP